MGTHSGLGGQFEAPAELLELASGPQAYTEAWNSFLFLDTRGAAGCYGRDENGVWVAGAVCSPGLKGKGQEEGSGWLHWGE